MGPTSSHSSLNGRLTSVIYGEPQVLGVNQVVFSSSMRWGNGEACGVYAWLAVEPPFARGHVIIVVFRVCIIVGRRRGVSPHYWGERSTWWRWRKSWDFLLFNLCPRGGRTVLPRYGTAWISRRGCGAIGHGFSCGGVKWGPPWLVKDSIHQVLGARVTGRHADM
jgi:hypothetical protein